MKRIALVILSVMMMAGCCMIYTFADTGTGAKAAVVMDVETGRVLFSKNPYEKLPMASTTKIMTTLVAVESGKLNETVKVSNRAAFTEGSSIYLKPGEALTVEELLYAIMLRSGNDASMAVAEHIGGSVEGFVEMMNQKAKEIGALNTHFANPHGLDNPQHYTTAYDLALIASHALRNSKFAEIVKTKNKTISGPPHVNWDRAMQNKNKMLWQYEGGDGVKTGFTNRAGRCLVSSATHEGWQLCSVVLNCGPMWEESTHLLNYGFGNYSKQKVVYQAI
jgi:D-alanyl-D-alanine carboxypeptidase (penicillin-binding protein 5/6)